MISPGLAKMSAGEIDIPMQAVALGGAVLLFLPGIEVLTWKEAQGDVDWGAIILICAGISIGLAIYDTGAARWLAWLGLSPIVQTPQVIRVFLIVLLVCVMHLAFSSNTVTGTIVIPLLIVLANDLGINPWLICAPAAFASSLAFVLVTETPTNVVPYSAGYFSIKDMVVPALVMTLGAALLRWTLGPDKGSLEMEFSCHIIGSGTLPIRCAKILMDRGHVINGVLSTDPTLLGWAEERGLACANPHHELLSFLNRRPFDFLFSVVNEHVLPTEVLDIPRNGAINYHDGPLPRYGERMRPPGRSSIGSGPTGSRGTSWPRRSMRAPF